MARKKIIPTTSTQKIRPMVFYIPGETIPWRITNQLDHTWFLTVFGNNNIDKPYNANEFIEFVHDNYDKDAIFEIGSYGIVADCVAVLRFSALEYANKFLSDFKEILSVSVSA